MNSGKKTKQQLLQESEERFRVMFEDHGAVMLLIEPDSGQITDANEAAAQFYGYSREQLRAMCIDQINQLRPEEVAAECRKAVRRVKNEFVFPHRLASGDVRFVEVYSSPVTIQGRPMLFSIIHDITDRNRSEQALRGSEERFRALVQASSDAVFRTSPDWTEMRHLVGRNFIADTQEPSQTWLQKYVHPDDQPQVMAAIEEAIRAKGVFESTHRVLRAEGSLGWTFSRAIPILDARGEITEWFGMDRDITARKEAQEALRDSTKRLTTIFQMSPVGIFFSRSSDAKFIDVNEAFLETIGYAREQVIGRTPSELGLWVAPGDRGRFGRRLAGQGRIDGIELKHRRKNGEVIDVQIILLPLDIEGESCFIGTLTDITERKQAALRERREHYETAFANRILRLFVEHDGDELFHRVLAVVQDGMASKHGVFGYIAEPGHLMCPSLSKMLDECEIEGKCIHYPPGKWKGLWARALTEKRSFYTNVSPRVPPGHLIIHNNLAAPILFQGEAIGLLNLANKEGGYTEEDRVMLDAIAARMAPLLYAWIQRKLHDDERKRAEETLKKAHDELEKRVQERTTELSVAVGRLRVENIQRKQLEDTLRESENKVRFFASQCLSAQETERKRIAGELHDSIAASLSAMRIRIDTIADEMKHGRGSPGTLLEIGSKVAEINNEVRRIMADLRPSILDDLGIIPAVNWLCREYRKAYSHIHVEKQAEIAEEEVPDALKTPIFRIVQEAMNNIAKYSQASHVNLSLRKEDGRILLSIKDNGQGFDLARVKKGMGLSTMRERAELSGGSFNLESAPGQGAVIQASWRL